MPKTRRELIDQILDQLGVLVPGQAPGDETVARVDSLVNPSFAMLAALGVVYVADAGLEDPPTGGEIEDALFLPLAAWIAFKAAGAFNLGNDPSLKVLADEAEMQLRTIGRPAPTRQILRTDEQLRGIRTRAPVGNFTRGT
jgi:hypothetical protein